MIKKHAHTKLHLNNTTSDEVHLAPTVELNAESSNVPTHIMVIPEGHVSGRDGRWWNNKSPSEIVKAFIDGGVELPVDYEHGSEKYNADGEPRPAAGWITSLQEMNGAIYANVKWTDKAITMIAAREYRYISPAFNSNDKTITRLSSVGLVQHPNLAALPALNNKNPNSKTEEPVKEREMKKDQLIELCKILGLQPDAADDVIVTAVNKLKLEGETALNSLNKAPSLDTHVPRADYDLIKTDLNTAQTKLTEIETNAKDAEIETLVGDAVAAGKITPANKQTYVDICNTEGGMKAFENLIAGSPPTNLNSKGNKLTLPTGGQAKLTDDQISICKMTGVDEAEYLANL